MTTSLSAASAVLAGGTSMVLLILGISRIMTFIRFRSPVPSLRDQVTTARYVMRYDDALQWRDVSSSNRRSLTDELRRNIADAAATDGVRGALERLGDPRDLAGAVVARDRGPTWAVGGAVAIGLWFFFQLGAVFGLGVLAVGIERLAPPSQSVVVATPLLPGVTFDVETDASGAVHAMSVETHQLTWLIPIAGGLIFSRPWRLLTAKRARRASREGGQG